MAENSPSQDNSEQPAEPKKQSGFSVKSLLFWLILFTILFSPGSFGYIGYGLSLIVDHGLLQGYSGTPGSAINVPEPYNALFAEAGAKYQVQPALIAAIFYIENGKAWKDPNGPWPESSAHAKGPFQFTDPTWQDFGVDGDGDGFPDVWNLKDSAYSASYMLSKTGAGNFTTDLKNLEKAIGRYNNNNRNYIQNVVVAFNKFFGLNQGGGSSGVVSCNDGRGLNAPCANQLTMWDHFSNGNARGDVACGVTSVYMLVNYYKMQNKLRDGRYADASFIYPRYLYRDSRGNGPGAQPTQYLTAAFGSIKTGQNADATNWAVVKAQLKAGNPVVLYTSLSSGRHIVLLVGYDSSSDSFIYNDPAGGKRKIMSASSLAGELNYPGGEKYMYVDIF